MTKSYRMRATVAGLVFVALTACGGARDLGASRAAANPNVFSGAVEGTAMTGVFNPSGFSGAQVRRLVQATCRAPLAAFGTRQRDDGLTLFSGVCTDWYGYAYAVYFERAGGSEVVIEVIGNQAGNVVMSRLRTKL